MIISTNTCTFNIFYQQVNKEQDPERTVVNHYLPSRGIQVELANHVSRNGVEEDRLQILSEPIQYHLKFDYNRNRYHEYALISELEHGRLVGGVVRGCGLQRSNLVTT